MPTNTVGKGSSEASIDQVNIWMRSTPWYQAQMRSWGQDPGHPTLTENQSAQIKRLAQANGVVVDEGNVELDDHGNFNPIGHKLRNTLIVAGVAAATIATMGAAGVFAGGAAGTGAAAGAGGTLASTTIGTGAIGGIAGGTGLAGGAAAAGAGAAGVGGAAVAGLSYADILKYGLPQAGNIVGGLIQAKAASSASDAQQKYLEEALAYQKESDLYTRKTDEDRYAAKMGLDATALAKADQRYGDYQGRIAPFIANGTSSNDRMAALLGLPARTGGGGFASGASSGPPASQRVARDPATDAAVDAALKANNSNDDPEYWKNQIAAHGDSSTKSWAYWKDFIARGDGVGKGYAGASAPAPPAPAAATSQPITTQPQARSAAAVQMRAPDGSVQSVPADQVDHYKTLGATLLGAAA